MFSYNAVCSLKHFECSARLAKCPSTLAPPGDTLHLAHLFKPAALRSVLTTYTQEESGRT